MRDPRTTREAGFPVPARGACVHDSQERRTVVDIDSTVEIDGARFAAGDLLIAGIDGLVVTRAIEDDASRGA